MPPLGPWVYPTDRYYYGWYSEPVREKPADSEIKSIVVDRLRKNRYTKDDYITVDVKKSVVILTGTVSTAVAKRAAGDDAWDTRGVEDVSNQLEVAS